MGIDRYNIIIKTRVMENKEYGSTIYANLQQELAVDGKYILVADVPKPLKLLLGIKNED